MTAPADTLEFHVPEGHHLAFDLAQQLLKSETAAAEAVLAQAKAIRAKAQRSFGDSMERLLREALADKLPNGKVPEGYLLGTHADKRTITLRRAPAQTPAKAPAGRAAASQGEDAAPETPEQPAASPAPSPPPTPRVLGGRKPGGRKGRG